MTLYEYQQQSRRTCPTLGEKLDLCHMVLGMVSELPELEEALILNDKNKIGDESTDGTWYLSNYCTFRGYDLEKDILFNTRKTSVLGNSILQLSDMVKKYVAYDKPINQNKEKELLADILFNYHSICENNKIDFLTQLDKNIEKLKIRFPDKFDKNLAINRNLEAEKQVLCKD